MEFAQLQNEQKKGNIFKKKWNSINGLQNRETMLQIARVGMKTKPFRQVYRDLQHNTHTLPKKKDKNFRMESKSQVWMDVNIVQEEIVWNRWTEVIIKKG